METMWKDIAKPEQLPPDGDWKVWLFYGGRGCGKTRAGAEWVKAEAETPQRIAIVGETTTHAERMAQVIFDLHGGLEWEYDKILWPNGSVAKLYSGYSPLGLKDVEFDVAWVDEIAHFDRPSEALWNLLTGEAKPDMSGPLKDFKGRAMITTSIWKMDPVETLRLCGDDVAITKIVPPEILRERAA